MISGHIIPSPRMLLIFLSTFAFDAVLSTSSDCGYFTHSHVASPLGSEFCHSDEYFDREYTNHTESHYFVCESGVPYRYSFSNANCTGNSYIKHHASVYYDGEGESYSYSCSDIQCDYIHYSIKHGSDGSCTDSSWQSSPNLIYSSYRVVDYCATYIEANDTSFSSINYFTFACDSDTLYNNLYYSSDCSGFPMYEDQIPYQYNCFTIHECSQSILECGTTETDAEYHVGDIIEDVSDVFTSADDLCNTPGGTILSTVLPPLGIACGSVTVLGAICNVFDISECSEREHHDTIVASCWSSNTFSYDSTSTLDSFSKYIGDNYGIDATFESTSDVTGEDYKQTEVYLDNCGRLDNYWIGGVYDSHDNGEQNDIVSDVVEYLVNQGIADADNAVGGISSTDQQESNGVLFTDVVRSKRGLLLHYDEEDYLETYYGIYFCEFNVITSESASSVAPFCINYCVWLLYLLCVLFIIMS